MTEEYIIKKQRIQELEKIIAYVNNNLIEKTGQCPFWKKYQPGDNNNCDYFIKHPQSHQCKTCKMITEYQEKYDRRIYNQKT